MPPNNIAKLLYTLTVLLFDLATSFALLVIGVLIFISWVLFNWLIGNDV